MRLVGSLTRWAILIAVLFVGFTVPIGKRTLARHIQQIWASDEAQELVEGVKESGAPLVERVKRGVEAGLDDAETPPINDPPAPDTKNTKTTENSDAPQEPGAESKNQPLPEKAPE